MIIFYFFLLKIIQLIKPVILIRFGKIRWNQVGHLIFETEHLLVKKSNSFITLNFLSIENPIANNFLYKKYKKLFPLSSKSNFFYKIAKNISLFKNSGSHILYVNFAPITDMGYNGIPDYVNKQRIENLSFLELEKEKNFLKNLHLERKNYVCFHVRDQFYYNFYKPHGKEILNDNYSFRDSSVINMKNSIEFLAKKNLKIIRCGKGASSTINFDKKFFLDYAMSENQNDENDIYILKNCLFFIGTHTGLTLVPVLYKKPILWINSFWRGVQYNDNINDIIVPKKLWSKDENRFLTFDEMRKLGPPNQNLYESYKKYNIEVIENTEEEILDATKEMFLKVNNKWIEDEETQYLKHKYLNLLWKDYDYGNLCKYPIISSTFIKNNKFLLDKTLSSKKIIPFCSLNKINSFFYLKNEFIDLSNENNIKFSRRGLKYNIKNKCFVSKNNGPYNFRFKINSIEEDSNLSICIGFKSIFIKNFYVKIELSKQIFYIQKITQNLTEYSFLIPKFITNNYQYFYIDINPFFYKKGFISSIKRESTLLLFKYIIIKKINLKENNNYYYSKLKYTNIYDINDII